MSDLFQTIAEKAESKKQQRLMGMVRAVQKGEMKSPSETVAKLAKSMKKKDVKDFASTKHDGLPEKKKVDEGFKQMPGERMASQRDRLEGKARDLEKGRETKKKSERAAKYRMQSNSIRNAGLQDFNAKGEKYHKDFHSKYRREETEIEESAWQRKEGKNPSGGLNEKGRKSYERENPGSDLKAPQPEGGPRKRSFCARMGGMKGPMKDEKGRPTRKALALRKWKC